VLFKIGAVYKPFFKVASTIHLTIALFYYKLLRKKSAFAHKLLSIGAVEILYVAPHLT
jgi:hypothetical protein